MTISLRWLGHSTVVLDVGASRLITDPLLRQHAGVLRRTTPPPTADAYAGVDAVLLSHLHLDHADLPSLRRLRPAPVVSSPPVADWLAAQHIPGLAIGTDWVALGPGVEARLVPAAHHSRPLPHRPNDAHGFLVRSAEAVVWFAGDTAAYPEMVDLPRLAGGRIDVALLPIHGWGPRLSAGHLDAVGAADVCATIGARYVVPIHYGTLHPVGFNLAPRDWMQAPARRFAAALPWLAPATTLITLEPMGRPWRG